MSKQQHQELTLAELLELQKWITACIESIIAQNPSSGTVKAFEGTNPNPPLPPKP